jgi:hypothetical protein
LSDNESNIAEAIDSVLHIWNKCSEYGTDCGKNVKTIIPYAMSAVKCIYLPHEARRTVSLVSGNNMAKPNITVS